MTIATISPAVTLTAPLTVTSFLNAVKTAMATATVTTPAAGYTITTTLFDDMTASGYVVYQITTDSTKAKGVAFLRISATLVTTNLTVSQSLSDTWNVTTHAVTGAAAGTASTNVVFNSNTNMTLVPVKHPEAQLVIVEQGTTPFKVLGWFRPLHKIVEWDESSCPYVFIALNNTLASFNGVSATLYPFTSANGTIPMIPHTQYQSPNKVSGLPPIKLGPLELLPSSNEGGCGSFSSDFAVGGCSGISRLANTVTVGSSIYTILSSNTANASILIQTT